MSGNSHAASFHISKDFLLEKNKKSQIRFLGNGFVSTFVLMSIRFLFETVFFVETIHTSICLSELLTSSVEWV